MKERLVTLACAMGALLLFLAMFARTETGFDPRKEVPRPTTAERRANGYYAAISWLEAENVRAISLRDRFDKLPQREDLAPTGNLLVVTLPATAGFKTEEFVPLDRWIRAGNTLLVLAALSDNPDWAYRLAGLTPGDLNLLTGLEYETTRMREARLQKARESRRAQRASPLDESANAVEDFRAFAEPLRSALVPNREHAYLQNVDEAVALSDYSRQTWTVQVPYEGFVLVLAHDRDTQEGVLWTRPLGNGRIIVSGFGTLFTNRALGLADNAQFFANMVSATVASNGTVLFDDAHQGLGAAYDPERFYRDPRLHITLAILVGLWLIWVVGSTRLRVPVQSLSGPREADLVRATGGFLARVLGSGAAAQRMFEHFFNRVRMHSSEPPDKGPPWSTLERHARIAAVDIDQLKRWYAAAQAGRRVPLTQLHNLIVRVHEQMS
jgi:hypothetical protein